MAATAASSIWAWNRVEDDVKDDQKDDPADPHALLLMPTIHGKAPFMAAIVSPPTTPLRGPLGGSLARLF